MSDYLDSAKDLARNYRNLSKANSEDKPDLSKRQLNHAVSLESLIEEVEQARSRLRPVSTEYGDISDLPDSVLAELNLAKIDELEQQLRDIVASCNGREVGLDPIIIELWRRHKVTHPRKFIMNKLYRMSNKGLIESVEGRKGVYMLPWQKAHQSNPFDLEEDVPF